MNNKILKRQSMKLYLIGALIGLSGAIIFGACSPKEAAESVQPETSAPQQESAENADAPQPASEPESEPIPEPVSEPEPEDALVAYQYDAAGRLVSADYGTAHITYAYDDNGNLLTRETITTESSAALPAGEIAAAGLTPLQAERPESGQPITTIAMTLILSAASCGALFYMRTQSRRRGRPLPVMRILVNVVVAASLLIMPSTGAAAQFAPPADGAGAGDPQDEPKKESTTHTQSDSRTTTLTTSDPISTATGEYFFDMPLLDLGGPLPLDLDFYYGSQVVTKRMDDGLPGRFRTNHRPTLHVYFAFEPDVVFVEYGLGQEVGFHRTADGWQVYDLEGVRYQLTETEKFFYFMDPLKEVVIIFIKFHADEKVIATLPLFIIDRNGNQLTYTYSNDGLTPFVSGPSTVVDGLGRGLRFTYQKFTSGVEPYDIPYLVKVEDQAGRHWSFSYEVSPEDNPMEHGYDGVTLRSMEDPLGNLTTFHYSDIVLISALEKPQGNTPYTQTYDTELTDRGVVLTQTDAYGNTTHISPDVFSSKFELDDNDGNPLKIRVTSEESQFTVTNPDGAEQTYTHAHESRVVSSYTDAAGNTVAVEADPVQDQITSFTDRMGDTTAIAYHPESGKLESITNANGDTISFSYTQQEQSFTNPLVDEQVAFTFYKIGQVDYADGSGIALSYDERGNVIAWEGPAGESMTLTYNERGQVLSSTNPLGGTTTFEYNDDGTLAAMSDPQRGETSYTYDKYKRLVQTTHADGTFIKLTYDLNDRLTAVTNENGDSYRFNYDQNGNIVEVTDPLGEKTANEYDLLDRLSAASDPLGGVTKYTYDPVGRLESITDPAGILTHYNYDANGWLSEVNIGGHGWTTNYDAEGIPISLTSPLGNATLFESDRLGFITSVRDPLGGTVEYRRDTQSRITDIIDPLGHTTSYTYDGRGSLTSVTLPEVGDAEYTWNDMGLLTEITDFNGYSWTIDYSPMGGMLSLNDPLGNISQFEYDPRGRMAGIVLPDGESQAFTYDPAGRLLQRAGDGFTLDFAYDDLNRITETTGLSFTYDLMSRVVETRSGDIEQAYGAVYDASGRLTSATYGQALTVTYSYDPQTGLLAAISDDLTASEITFIYDDDFRLVGLERSNGVNGEYAWDDAGRLTGITEGSILALEMAYDAAGQVVKVSGGTPADAASALAAGKDTFEVDAASQIDAPGYAYDSKGQLLESPQHSYQWDGLSRLAQVDDTTLSYSGLGDLLTRSEAGQTTAYAHNYALSGAPVAAEVDAGSGEALRYYVWSPGGQLLYSIDAGSGGAVSFYHYDHHGSTLALTDSQGALTDAYAYAPYGQIVSRTGSSAQPFTFVGKWGVRQEGDAGDLYQMGMRYYDAEAGRFLTREPLWPQIDDPRLLNPYQYAFGNPVSNNDISGAAPKGLFSSIFGEATGTSILDAPTSPWGAIFFFLNGTKTGYEGDPEWGYGNISTGFVSKESYIAGLKSSPGSLTFKELEFLKANLPGKEFRDILDRADKATEERKKREEEERARQAKWEWENRMWQVAGPLVERGKKIWRNQIGLRKADQKMMRKIEGVWVGTHKEWIFIQPAGGDKFQFTEKHNFFWAWVDHGGEQRLIRITDVVAVNRGHAYVDK